MAAAWRSAVNVKLRITLKALVLLLAALGAYLWASGYMNSLFAYRSALAKQPPKPGVVLGAPETRRVVFVLVDGLRYDTASDPQTMPFLNELRQGAAWAKMRSRPPSYSEAGYTVLFTGAWPEISDGHTINAPYEEIRGWTQDNLFSAVGRAGLKSAVSGYYWFEKLIPQADVADHFYTPGEDREADRQVVQAALPWLTDSAHQLILIHLDQVDYAGHHEGGARDPNWNAAAGRVDELLRQIASQLDLSQDTLLIVSDHGHIDQGGHGGQDAVVLEEPFLLTGAGVKSGDFGDIQMVDIAPTLAALLGVNLPASSQGRVRTEMLTLAADKAARLPDAIAAQQRQLLENYQRAIGHSPSVPPGSDPVAVYQHALQAARNQRLNSERLPRLLIGLVWLVIPIALFLRRFNHEKGWLLIGAGIYLAAFNLSYVLLLKKTYSLSSVISPNNLILESAGLALGALLLSGMVYAWQIKVRQRGRTHAAEALLNLALIISYLLSGVVLVSFVLNGALVTWTLPDFQSSFLGFISLIQILFVGLGGMILAGIASLFAKKSQRQAG